MAEEKTAEQKEAEAKREELRKVAMKNLDSSLWNYAAPKLVTSEQYGSLAKASEGFYQESVSKSPEQHVYEQLFLPQLQKEGGAITSPYLQNVSLKILQESLFSVKVEDAMKYSGVKNIGDKFKGKYVSDIGEKEAGQIVGSCMQYQADEKVKGILDLRQKGIASGLEELLANPKEEAPKK